MPLIHSNILISTLALALPIASRCDCDLDDDKDDDDDDKKCVDGEDCGPDDDDDDKKGEVCDDPAGSSVCDAPDLCVNVGGVGGCHPTISDAIAAADPGDTISVDVGTYASIIVTIAKEGITLCGANAGVPVNDRTFGDPSSESVVIGEVHITAPNVVLNGFSLTAPPDDERTEVVIEQSGSGARVLNNFISDLVVTGDDEEVVAVVIDGADDVSIICNRISELQDATINPDAGPPAVGILVNGLSGESSSEIVIRDNVLEDIFSSFFAAGILVQNNNMPTGVEIRDNRIESVRGTIALGVSLEAPTPGALVRRNTIVDVIDLAPGDPSESVAVYFGPANSSLATAAVHLNQFEGVTSGIFVDAMNPAAGPVDGTCNWWGSASGPSGEGPGTGVLVSEKVTFSPWLLSPQGACP